MEKYIANIITTRKLNVDKLIKKSASIEKVNLSHPTLIVGWSKVKQLFPNQSILDKQISNDLFWTFDKNERKNEFEKDIKKFFLYVINSLTNKIVYKFINVLTCKFSTYKRLISFIKNDEKKVIWIEKNSFIYILYKNNVIGISLSDLDYAGISIEKVVNLIKSNSNNFVFTDLSTISYSLINTIGANKQIIPYLLEKQIYL